MNRISLFRTQANLSQARLAREVGVTTSTIGNYELGIRNINLGMCWKIVVALHRLGIHCSFEEVFPDPSQPILSNSNHSNPEC